MLAEYRAGSGVKAGPYGASRCRSPRLTRAEAMRPLPLKQRALALDVSRLEPACQDLVHPQPIKVHDLEAPAFGLPPLAGLRQALEAIDHEAGRRLEAALARSLDADEVSHLVERHRAGEEP